jgi:hypothetical protein
MGGGRGRVTLLFLQRCGPRSLSPALWAKLTRPCCQRNSSSSSYMERHEARLWLAQNQLLVDP